jgi:hypothetical protein
VVPRVDIYRSWVTREAQNNANKRSRRKQCDKIRIVLCLYKYMCPCTVSCPLYTKATGTLPKVS